MTTSKENIDPLQTRISTLCSQILTTSLNKIHALVNTHAKLNSFKKYPEFKKEGYIDEKLVQFRNKMIKSTAKDHMDLLLLLEEFKTTNGNLTEVNRLNQDIDKISTNLRNNYERKGPSIRDLTLKIQEEIDSMNLNMEESINDIQKTPKVLTSKRYINSNSIQNLTNTPKRVEKIVKYYRVDKDGNKVEVDGPLTPITPPINTNSQMKTITHVTPTRSNNVARNHASHMSQTTNNQISFTPIGMRYGQEGSVINSHLNTPSQIRREKQSYTESKILGTPQTPNAFKTGRGVMTYHKNHRGGLIVPSSPIIPPLNQDGPIATPNRNYELKTITNYNTGVDVDTHSQLQSIKNEFFKPTLNFFDCSTSKQFYLFL